jgi:predicted transcriptional regulator
MPRKPVAKGEERSRLHKLSESKIRLYRATLERHVDGINEIIEREKERALTLQKSINELEEEELCRQNKTIRSCEPVVSAGILRYKLSELLGARQPLPRTDGWFLYDPMLQSTRIRVDGVLSKPAAVLRLPNHTQQNMYTVERSLGSDVFKYCPPDAAVVRDPFILVEFLLEDAEVEHVQYKNRKGRYMYIYDDWKDRLWVGRYAKAE